MKRQESTSKKSYFIENKSEYYKNIGEKAAIYTFTKHQSSSKKLDSINPQNKLTFNKEETRKSEPDLTPLLSPLSRDISHLRDKLNLQSPKLLDFHTKLPDLSEIKIPKPLNSFLDISSKFQTLPQPFRELSQEMQANPASTELPSIEKLLFGPPTGRQEVSQLKKWFESMKESPEYELNDENKRQLYIMCSREVIKQVSVQCIERGEILHELLEFFIGKFDKGKEEIKQKVKKKIKKNSDKANESKNKEVELSEKITKLETENYELKKDLEKKKQEVVVINNMLLNEKEKVEEIRSRDSEFSKGLRFIKKGSTGKESFFKEGKGRDLEDKKTQTEVLVYSRFMKRGSTKTKTEKIEETGYSEESKTEKTGKGFAGGRSEDLIEELEPKFNYKLNEFLDKHAAEDLVLERLPNEAIEINEELNEVANENIKESQESFIINNDNQESLLNSLQIVDFCDQDCQTNLELRVFYCEYVEANINKYTDSDSDDFFDHDKEIEEPVSINLVSGDSPKLNLNSKSSEFDKKNPNMKNVKKTLTLEVIPDRDSADESTPFNISPRQDREDEEKLKNTKSTPKSNNSSGKSEIPFTTHKKPSQKSSKTRNTVIQTKQIDHQINLLKETPEIKLQNLEKQIQEKQLKLNYLKEKINKKLLFLKSISTDSNKPGSVSVIPKININELDGASYSGSPKYITETSQVFLSNRRDSKRFLSQDSSFSLSSEHTEKREDLKKSETLNPLSPSFLYKESFDFDPEQKNSAKRSGSLKKDCESVSKESSEIGENTEEKPEKRNPVKKSLTHITEFNLFNFNRKSTVREHSRKNPAKRMISGFLSKKESYFRKRAIMSRKMLHKTISNIYLSFYSKNDRADFAEFLYDEFNSRYGIKKVADRKFTEFVSSAAACENSKRTKTFLRFIGAGKLVQSSDFSNEALIFYLNCFHFLTSSKIGISTIDDTSDAAMLPAARVAECAKEKLQNFDKGILNNVLKKIEKNKINDPKKINSQGMVDVEMFLETITEIFENHKNKISKGVEFLINVLKFQENQEFVSKFEAFLLACFFSPHKKEDFDQLYLGKDSISSEEFLSFSIERGLFSMEQVSALFHEENRSIEETWNIIQPGVDSLRMALFEMKSAKNALSSESFGIWETKLEKLVIGVGEREPFESLVAFKIYSDEITRIRNCINKN